MDNDMHFSELEDFGDIEGASQTRHEHGTPLPPRENMLNYARSIATAQGEDIPEECLQDYKKLSKWIDARKDGPILPTRNMLAFAEDIAAKTGRTIPDDARRDAKKLSAWIDANKTAMPPSEKMVSLMKFIAQKGDLSIPDEALASSEKASAWIDANKHILPPRGNDTTKERKRSDKKRKSW